MKEIKTPLKCTRVLRVVLCLQEMEPILPPTRKPKLLARVYPKIRPKVQAKFQLRGNARSRFNPEEDVLFYKRVPDRARKFSQFDVWYLRKAFNLIMGMVVFAVILLLMKGYILSSSMIPDTSGELNVHTEYNVFINRVAVKSLPIFHHKLQENCSLWFNEKKNKQKINKQCYG